MLDLLREQVLAELDRHERLATAALAQLHDKPPERSSQAAKAVRERVSQLVAFVLDHQLLASCYRDLLEIPTHWHEQTAHKKLILKVKKAIRSSIRALERAGEADTASYTSTRQFSKWRLFEGSFEKLCQLIRQRLVQRRAVLPALALREYQAIALELSAAEQVLRHTTPEYIQDTYSRFGLEELRKVVEFDIRRSGHDAAQALAQVYRSHVPAADQSLELSPVARLSMLATSPLDNGSIDVESTRAAISDVCALLRQTLTSQQVRRYLTDRLCSFLALYGRPQLEARLKQLSSKQGKRVEEQVFRPLVEEFVFNHGVYAIAEAQLGNRRIDLLLHDADACYLYELKQWGYGSRPESSSAVAAKIREALKQTDAYMGRLKAYPRLANEAHILVFVNSIAEFVGADGTPHGTEYTVERDGSLRHIRIVACPLEDSARPFKVQLSDLID